MIVFKPFLGLANRMRAINSAVAFSKLNDTKIKIVWAKDFKLNSKFSDLFLYPYDNDIEIFEPVFSLYNLPFTIRFPVYMNLVKFIFDKVFDKSLIINNINSEYQLEKIKPVISKTFLAAFNEFYPAPFDSKLFKPQISIQGEIDRLSKDFTNSTYGVHIRRTDNPISTELSPTELYEVEIQKIILLEPEAKFYVASDSSREKKILIKKFGEKIITYFFDTSRQSKEGIKNAVIDLFILSRTKMILGSYFSSFSDIAAAIGNIPLRRIKK